MKPDPITAFGLFVLALFRPAPRSVPPRPKLREISAETLDQMAELRAALQRQLAEPGHG